jgi:aspartate aminotransferase
MFEALNPLPADPILGLSAAFRQDDNPDKIDLGVGVYKDESGATPIMGAVKKAEARRLDSETTKTYQSPAGDPEFDLAIAELLLGKMSTEGRVATAQAPGGTGGLRIAAGLIRRSNPGATVWLSKPTWANHRPVFEGAGLAVQEYPYYSAEARGVDFEAMSRALRQLGPGDVVVFHGCCHNPTGADLTEEQWESVAEIAQERGFFPLLDIAYQGFGRGLEEDAFSARCLARQVPELIAVSSCSKNFGLYRERTGAVCLVTADRQRGDQALQHLLNVARSTYSMPPAHGAAVVSSILGDAGLRADWEQELTQMRERMNDCRNLLADRLEEAGLGQAFDHIRGQFGMFSYLGVSVEQVRRLREEFGIYMVDSSRINIAGVNQQNLGYLADALVAVSG